MVEVIPPAASFSKENMASRRRRPPGSSLGRQAVMVALTGWGQDEDRRRSQEAGFDQHRVKPVDPAALEKLLTGLQAPA